MLQIIRRYLFFLSKVFRLRSFQLVRLRSNSSRYKANRGQYFRHFTIVGLLFLGTSGYHAQGMICEKYVQNKVQTTIIANVLDGEGDACEGMMYVCNELGIEGYCNREGAMYIEVPKTYTGRLLHLSVISASAQRNFTIDVSKRYHINLGEIKMNNDLSID